MHEKHVHGSMSVKPEGLFVDFGLTDAFHNSMKAQKKWYL